MNDVLDSLPKYITRLTLEDAMRLIEALRTLFVSKLQVSTLAARLCKGLECYRHSAVGEEAGARIHEVCKLAFGSHFSQHSHGGKIDTSAVSWILGTGKPFPTLRF